MPPSPWWLSALVILLLLSATPSATAEEPNEAALLQRLAETHDRNAEYEIGQGFGRLRSVRGLERLVERRSGYGITGYGNSMTSSRDEFLAPEAEALIVANFDDAEIGSALRSLVVSAKYRTRPLFDLFQHRLARRDPGNDHNSLAGQVCRTDLPVEPELLAILQAFPDGTYTLGGRALLYLRLAKGHYEPATPRIEQALAAEDPAESSSAVQALTVMGTRRSLAAAFSYAKNVRASGNTVRADQIARQMLLNLKHLPPEAPLDFTEFRTTLPSSLDASMAASLVALIQRRHERAGIPDLIALIVSDESVAADRAFEALLSIDDVAGWRQGLELLDRRKREGTISLPEYEVKTHQLTERLADPKKAAAEIDAKRLDDRRNAEVHDAARPVRQQMVRALELAEQEPERGIPEYEKTVAALESLVLAHADASDTVTFRRDLVQEYVRLGNLVRFALRQPARALRSYQKAASFEDAPSVLAGLALADTYEFDLQDKTSAIISYEALRRIIPTGAQRSPADQRELWMSWGTWLDHEIQFLRAGTAISQAVPRLESIRFLFLTAMLLGATDVSHPKLDTLLRRVDTARGAVDISTVRSTLNALPPSRLILARSVSLLAYLGPDELVAYLERQDPGRFWSASILTAAVLLTADPASQSSEFRIFPTPEDLQRIGENPFPVAAGRFGTLSGIRLDVASEEQFATPEKTWAVFTGALRRGDRAAALACFQPGTRRRFETAFLSMPDDIIQQLAESTLGIAIETSDRRQEYAVTLGPKRRAASISFVKALGSWLINGI